MTARELEATLLARCLVGARGGAAANDQREASVFQVAAGLAKRRFPRESANLLLASDQYFDAHPGDRLSTAEVVRNGWVSSMPRLRDMLDSMLSRQDGGSNS